MGPNHRIVGWLDFSHVFRMLGLAKVNAHQIFGYVIMIAASSFFTVFGGLMCFAPSKFSELMHWWARKIRFPQVHRQDYDNGADLKRRFPGFALFCFGSFFLLIIFLSLLYLLYT